MKLFFSVALLFLTTVFASKYSFSQTTTTNYGSFSNCTGALNFYQLDFTTTPSNVASLSVSTANADNQCCNLANNFGCSIFEITTDPNAVGLSWNTSSGPCGNVNFYYENCGVTVGCNEPVCFNPGTTVHRFMMCRTGGPAYTFTFTQIVAPTASPDIITAVGCTQTLTVSGLTNPVWTSVSPGAPGTYDANLNCTSCPTAVFTPNASTPSTVVYQVSGTINSPCAAAIPWSDHVSVTTYPTLFADAGPDLAMCLGGNVVSTASAIGGTAPFNFTWTNSSGVVVGTATNTTGNTGNVTFTQAGTYTVSITDATGCQTATDQVVVTTFEFVPTANAGNDLTYCGTPAPNVLINGSVTQTGTGIWSGGTGTFADNTTDLSLQYTPSAAEIAAGSVTLTLTPTNTLNCPFVTDQVTITLTQFQSLLALTPDHVSCNGLSDGAINLTITGGFPVNSILWSNGSGSEDISGLPAGVYQVTVTDVNGCQGVSSVEITQPTPLAGSITAQTNVSCFGGNNGSVTVLGSGATPGYTYSIDGGANYQASGTFSNLVAGNYTITIRDNEGCLFNVPVTITEPLAPLAVVLDN